MQSVSPLCIPNHPTTLNKPCLQQYQAIDKELNIPMYNAFIQRQSSLTCLYNKHIYGMLDAIKISIRIG